MANARQSLASGDRGRTTAYFGRLARTYGEGEYYAHRRAAVVEALGRELAAARQVLDLGCGNGAYLRDFARICAGARTVGADLSFEMLLEARRRARVGLQLVPFQLVAPTERVRTRPAFCGGLKLPPSAKIVGTALVQADASALPFRAGSQDLVLCSHLLQFVVDLDGCVSEIARCLKPGGVLVATLEEGSLRQKLRAIMGREEWEQFARSAFAAARDLPRTRRDEETYRTAFEKSGLGLEWRSAPFSATWADIEQLTRLRWIPVASESARDDIERNLARLRADQRFSSLQLDLTQRMLLGRKP